MPHRAIALATLPAILVAAAVAVHSPAVDTSASQSQEPTVLECSANKSSISDGGIVTITAILATEGGTPLAGQTIQWTDDPGLWFVDESSSSTNSDGVATTTYSLIFDTGLVGTETVTATFEGTAQYGPSSCTASFTLTSTCPPDICGTDFDYDHGDNNCDGDVNTEDALATLQFNAGLDYEQVPPCLPIGKPTLIKTRAIKPAGLAQIRLGDTDCDDDVDPVDALGILRYLAELPVLQNEPCPDIGNPF